MELINRDVLIVFPRQPFFDWVNNIFPDEEITIPEFGEHDEGTVYLLPEKDHHSMTIEYLKKNFKPIFEEELLSWCEDEEIWPRKLTWDMFEKWFHYSIQTMVYDTQMGPVMKEEL